MVNLMTLLEKSTLMILDTAINHSLISSLHMDTSLLESRLLKMPYFPLLEDLSLNLKRNSVKEPREERLQEREEVRTEGNGKPMSIL